MGSDIAEKRLNVVDVVDVVDVVLGIGGGVVV